LTMNVPTLLHITSTKIIGPPWMIHHIKALYNTFNHIY
jgi:hypothetical protein